VIDDIISKHIQNQLPIFLLDLENLQLIRRSALMMILKDKIQKYKENHILNATPEELLPQRAEEWIKGETTYTILSHRWLNDGELGFNDISKFANHQDKFIKLIKFVSPSDGANILSEVIGLALNNADNTDDNPAQLQSNMLELYKILFPADQKQALFPSFVKVIIFCWISTRYSSRFVWFDTGCINKASSVELEESIRSMFNWYSNSKICVVHLADTTDVTSLNRDQWFTRGWTLQELLAPNRVKFFGESWKPITTYSFDDDKNRNTKSKKHLWNHILGITDISSERIFNFKPGVHQARDALVWLSKRRTTRVEDMAYCLIGLLGIPLSIAYGEGETAFYRLQVEILQRSPDMGLFVWQGYSATGNSMLAARPDYFSSLAFQPLFSQTSTDEIDRSYSLTNFGLRIPLPVYSIPPGKWHMGGEWGNPVIIMEVAGLGRITVKVQTKDNYESVELAVLGKERNRWYGDYEDLAIVLGFKDSQWKRISKDYIILSRSIKTVLRTRFIR
jgi:hypothetical protein